MHDRKVAHFELKKLQQNELEKGGSGKTRGEIVRRASQIKEPKRRSAFGTKLLCYGQAVLGGLPVQLAPTLNSVTSQKS